MNETIIIYHGGCRDGFCAAWVVNKYLCKVNGQGPSFTGKVIYHPGYYGQEPPDVTDKNVIIVDFCYPLEQMKKIADECQELIALDHHKTSEGIFSDLRVYCLSELYYTIIFNNNRSGAGIAWDYFFPNEARPWLVDYVEDRDLWLHKLHWSEEVNAYIACLEFDFTVWNNISKFPIEAIKQYGTVAKMKTEQYVREVCKNAYLVDINYPNADFDNFPGENYFNKWKHIPVVNICQVDCSEVLHELCVSHSSSPFSLYWFKRQDGMYQYGLRSIGDFDVSSVAKLFGGGGHKNAAGFQLDYLLEELK